MVVMLMGLRRCPSHPRPHSYFTSTADGRIVNIDATDPLAYATHLQTWQTAQQQ